MSLIKTSFSVKSKYEAFYTGGRIQLSSDGVYMFCGCGNKVNVLEISTGAVFSTIGQEEDEEISSFCLSHDDQYLVIATQHLLLRQWNWKEKKLIRTWKAIHIAPVISMAFDPTSTLLATGSADSTIKVWDIEKQYCTHNLRGHQGIISVVVFHPDLSRMQLYSAGEDYKVRVWNLQTSTCIKEVYAHYSLVTSILFNKDGSRVISSGRDAVVAIWDADQHKVIKTIPVYEVIESVILLPEGETFPQINVEDTSAIHFITAGNKGNLRVWNSSTSQCVFTTDQVHTRHDSQKSEPADTSEGDKSDDTQNIVQMIYNKQIDVVAVVTYDHNISLIGLDKLTLQKQFAGNNDEIVDVKYFGPDDKYAIVATNSMHIKVFQLDNWDCEILYGHTDIVLSIDVPKKGNMFISSGKDNTVRVWQLDPAKKLLYCLAICQGHTHAVGALAFARSKMTFFVSGSEDCTLKLWNVPPDLDPSVTKEIHAVVTERAHDKAVSCVDVAPNDKFVATGSMDKLAKLWRASDLKLLGVMRGHKRGIWCVQFSPIDQVLATSSGDGTVKLWSLTDFTCAKTFEGHDCAVLKVSFITRGMQLLSSGTSGLVKLWTIKTNECVKTLDEHEDKVWALTTSTTGDSFITGSADSSIIIWQDSTETEINEARENQEQFILQEQELSNLIQHKKYLKAIGLAITLEQPFRVLNIIKTILSEGLGEDRLHETLEKLRMDQIDALLRFASQWNTNSRHCHEAQLVVSSILKMYPSSKLQELGNIKSAVEGLVPYTDRHFARMSRLLQQSMFLEYTWQCMKNVATDGSLASTTVAMMAETNPTPPTVINSDDNSSSESEEETEELVTNDNASERLTAGTVEKENNKPDKTVQEDTSSESEEEIVPSMRMKTPKLNLYKEYCSKDNEHKKNNKKPVTKDVTSGQKRKITDKYTVVKDKMMKIENSQLNIDMNTGTVSKIVKKGVQQVKMLRKKTSMDKLKKTKKSSKNKFKK